MTVSGNDAVRAQVRVMMADGEGLRPDDAVANAVITLVLESLVVESAQAGGKSGGKRGGKRGGKSRGKGNNRTLATVPGPVHELAALHASDVLERIALLTAVADAAERLRRAERRGKGRKKAKRRLFEALAAWRDVVAGAG